MGSCQDGAGRTTSPAVEISSEMIVKTSLLCLLLLSPANLTFKLLPQEESFNVARQFSEEPIINYGIWGFLAGLADYGIRNAFTMTTTTTTTVATTATTTTAASTTSSTRRKHFRNKQEKKEKKEKKDRKKLKREQRKKKKEMEKMMKEEVPSVEEVVETVADIVDTADTVVEETAAEE